MKRTDDTLDDLPELEANEFTPAIGRRAWIEDANDLGDIGDSFSIGLGESDIDDIVASEA